MQTKISLILYILLLLHIFLQPVSTGTTLPQLQQIFNEFNQSPFVNLLLIYDSAKPQASNL